MNLLEYGIITLETLEKDIMSTEFGDIAFKFARFFWTEGVEEYVCRSVFG